MRKVVSFTVLILSLSMLGLLAMGQEPDSRHDAPKTFQTWSFEDLSDTRVESKRAYLSFLERSSMRMGLYHLPKGGRDGQSPHTQDESYYVVEGKGRFTCDGETVEVKPGEVIFVAAGLEHRFHDIEEDLELLVFFSAAKPMTASNEGVSEDDDSEDD